MKKNLEQGEVDKLQLRLDALKYGIRMTMMKIRVAEMKVEEVKMERLVLAHPNQELLNKKWTILYEG